MGKHLSVKNPLPPNLIRKKFSDPSENRPKNHRSTHQRRPRTEFFLRNPVTQPTFILQPGIWYYAPFLDRTFSLPLSGFRYAYHFLELLKILAKYTEKCNLKISATEPNIYGDYQSHSRHNITWVSCRPFLSFLVLVHLWQKIVSTERWYGSIPLKHIFPQKLCFDFLSHEV